MRLIDYIVPEAIILDLKATTKEAVIRQIVDGLVAASVVDSADAQNVVTFVQRIEEQFGIHFNGVIRLEARGRSIHRSCTAIAISRSPLTDFQSLDDKPVDIVAVQCLVAPDIQKGGARSNLAMQYLVEQTLVLSQEALELRDRLRQACSHEKVVALIAASPVEASGWYTEPNEP